MRSILKFSLSAILALTCVASLSAQKPPLQPYNAKYLGFGTGGGTANSQTVTYSPATTSYTVGQCVSWTPTVANTGAATLNVDGLGAVTLVGPNGAALTANAINPPYFSSACYDGTNFDLTTSQVSLVGGNAMIKPPASAAILYVNGITGSDSNDGLSPGSAMATIYHALCSLPAGNCTTAVAGAGMIDVFGRANVGGPVTNQGIWLLGAIDPNYASPPSGWLAMQGSNGILIKCDGGDQPQGITHPGGSCFIQGGSATPSDNKPWVWLSGVNSGLEISGFVTPYDAMDVLTGTNSNGVITGLTSGASNVIFQNDQFRINSGAAAGPTIDLGPNTFWVFFKLCIIDGNQSPAAISLATTAASVTSNVATLTMASNPVTAGFVYDSLAVTNSLPVVSLTVSGFTGGDTYFNGTWKPLSVTSTTITFALTHANASASSNGTASEPGLFTALGAGILLNPGAGGGQVHEIYLDDSEGYNAGIMVNPGSSAGAFDIHVNNYINENNTPALFWVPASGSATWAVTVHGSAESDSVYTSPVIWNQNYSEITLEGSLGNNGIPAIGSVAELDSLYSTGDLMFKLPYYTYAQLPTCVPNNVGGSVWIIDGSTNTWGATVSGSGSDYVMVVCDGSNWTVAGK